MTDPELLAKRLALIETSVSQLRTLARPDAIAHDIREQRFVEHTLQIAIQELSTEALAESLRRMVGFRNVLVHGYDDVDLGVVKDVAVNRLTDLVALVAAVRARAK